MGKLGHRGNRGERVLGIKFWIRTSRNARMPQITNEGWRTFKQIGWKCRLTMAFIKLKINYNLFLDELTNWGNEISDKRGKNRSPQTPNNNLKVMRHELNICERARVNWHLVTGPHPSRASYLQPQNHSFKPNLEKKNDKTSNHNF